ncbi:putative mpv17 pmp22 family protein [Cladorrhinum sp. PSN259]|nr:putative mpv17 pmp22 family protein [Cladorrhinum sp. PSN259]
MAVCSIYRAALRRQLSLLQKFRIQQRRGLNTNISSKLSVTERRPPTQIPVVAPNVVPKVSIFLRLGPLTRAFQAYGRAQSKRPYVTQVLTSLFIFTCGDFAAQSIGGKEYDPIRTARALLIGGTASIPSFLWVQYLSVNFNFSSRILSLLTKVVLMQTCFTPVFNTYFFGMQALLSGATMPEVWERITKTVPTSIYNSCKVWPIVMGINFAYVPLPFRSVFSGGIAVGWQTYLSYLNRQAERSSAIAKVDALEDPRIGTKMAT